MTIRDATSCTALPRVVNGAGCSHLRSKETFTLTMKELIDLLDAQPYERTCVPAGDLPVCAEDQSHGVAVTLPPRGPSVIMTDRQFGATKTSLEVACRKLGKRCTYVP